MRYALIITITCLLFVSCKKDNSAPATLTFQSISNTVLPPEGQTVFTFGFTDPTGTADSIFIQCIIPHCANSCFRDSAALPAFSSVRGQTGQISMTYGGDSTNLIHQTLAPQCGTNDTGYFRFELKTEEGIVSDTVNSPTIVITQ